MKRTSATLALVLALLLPTGVANADPAPGGAGIGDRYFPDYGNAGYDVSHYDIRLRYQPKTDRLAGTTTILAKATQDLSSFNLDFVLDVSAVRVNNRPARFVRKGDHELVVRPARPLESGEAITAVVTYAGKPSTVETGAGLTNWVRTEDGALAVNEPESAWWWFPSNDHPRDKATFDVSVQVPKGLQVLSNGTLRAGPVPGPKGWSRWNWRSVKPQATYLAFLVIGRYDLEFDHAADKSPIVNAYSRLLGEEGPAARAGVGRTDEIIEWAARIFGKYPFEARGGVVVPGGSLDFALETQTRPVYDSSFWDDGGNTWVVVHELAHQWFGDSVSVRNWRDIWLNEGFATYAEWLWSEKQGEGTVQELAEYVYASNPADDEFWTVEPGDPGPANIFDWAVYDRGALTVHAVRTAIGDKAFFRLLKAWTSERRYKTATTAQFQALAEKISGKNLDTVFTQWLYTAKRPPAASIGAASVGAAGVPAEPRSWDKIQATHRRHR